MSNRLIILCILFTPIALWAQDEVYHLSLEELSEVKVITASKTEELITNAPGIITVISSSEIERYGANSLLEVMERVTSSYVTGSHFFPQNVISFRGDLLSHYTNHILILLNNRPMRESYSGGIIMPILTSFPLSIVDRIEIIRSPGSVLYGTNAYSGVINIITKKPKMVELSGEVMGGRFSTVGTDINTTIQKGKWSFHAAGTSFQESGWELKAIDPNQTDSSMNYGESSHSAFIKAQHKNFSITSLITNSRQDFLGGVFNWTSSPDLPLREMNSTRGFVNMTQLFELGKKVELNAHLTFNHMNFRHYNYSSFSNDIMAELSNHFKVNSKLNFIIGGLGVYQTFGSKDGIREAPVPNNQNYFVSTYAQSTYQLIKYISITAGGQLNIPERVSPTFVPRIAIISNITNNFGAKALYGEAYRSPFAVETDFDIIIKNNADNIIGGLRGNPDLMSEKMKSLNFELFYHNKKYLFSATYFKNEQQDLITRKRAPDRVLDFVNNGSLFSHGFEFESKIQILNRLLVNINYSYQSNYNDRGLDDFTPAPNHMFKTGLSYSVHRGISISVFNSHIGEAPDIIVTAPDRKAYNPSSSSYNLLSANLSVSIPKLFNFETSAKDINFSIYGYNLLNESIYHPDFIGKTVNTIPARSPIGIYGKLKIIL